MIKKYPTEPQWLRSGWKPNARKRKTGNSEITPFPVSQQVTRTGFEKAGIFLLFSNSVRKSPKTNDLSTTKRYWFSVLFQNKTTNKSVK